MVMRENIRQYREGNYGFQKVPVDGGYLLLRTYDSMHTSQAPNQTRYMERSLGMSASIAVERNGIWAVWAPGWGIDVHYPKGKEPEYLRSMSDNRCELVEGEQCFCDGSALADGEQAWPAYKSGGLPAVFELLREWVANNSEHLDAAKV